MFYKISVIKLNFARFTGMHLHWSHFLIKLLALCLWLYLKETPAQVFSCEFYEVFKSTFFTEHHWITASVLTFA